MKFVVIERNLDLARFINNVIVFIVYLCAVILLICTILQGLVIITYLVHQVLFVRLYCLFTMFDSNILIQL